MSWPLTANIPHYQLATSKWYVQNIFEEQTMRHFQGYVYKEKRGKLIYWMARVCVTDVEGKPRNLKTSRKTKTEAKLALEQLRKRAREIAGGASVDSERMTFAE